MLFLYDLPNWLLGIIVVTTVVALSGAGYVTFRRVWRPDLTEEMSNIAVAVLGVVATMNALLLAFAAVEVWESFTEAQTAVIEEANSVSALARDLSIYDSAESRDARRMLRDYTEMVVMVEWRAMQRGGASVEVWNSFDRMFQRIGTLDPDTPRRAALLPEIWERINELLKQRRSRLLTSESAIPGTVWAVIIIGTALTIGTTFVLPPTRFHLWMIGLITVSSALVFYLIIAMDRPFAGKESIGPEPFEIAIGNMQRWDTLPTAPPR